MPAYSGQTMNRWRRISYLGTAVIERVTPFQDRSASTGGRFAAFHAG